MLSRAFVVVARPRGVMMKRMFSVAESNAPTDAPKLVLRELKEIPRDMRRKLRQQAEAANEGSTIKTSRTPVSRVALRLFLLTSGAGIAGWNFYLEESVRATVRETVHSTFLGTAYDWLVVQIKEICRPFTEPSRDKLLPDWPMPGYGIPEGFPPLPTLVLAVEDVLLHSEWDRKYGWRHAKRPHVDEFMETLSRHYEIVLYSSESQGLVEEVLAKLNQKGCAFHYLFRDATHFINNAHVKDLAPMNRDIKRIILIDTKPENFQLQPENAICIPPYTDGQDRSDRQLKDLIPFLVAVAEGKVQDVPKVLADFRDSDGVVRDVPSKYNAKVHALDERKRQAEARGLGGFVRGRLHSSRPPTALKPLK
ncbi:hypothetical protein H257_01202 [Aphanomyces astaci]|uniref:Mitochondrial import inner membrane translocase subunit TIM50 n=1 Tax=Aphanomyces astaci TaxID=112090 RepID=W4H9D8_APHAT|nr:hypothetical protein H257_01202 [Aphanomyces astaci]ETV87728.1 hypothetical protein H257_01202 [Aphanomyces astaci]|eukprot:XP_009822591.1 hypothetical protein H257_01202 [Aphanomyces astaci]